MAVVKRFLLSLFLRLPEGARGRLIDLLAAALFLARTFWYSVLVLFTVRVDPFNVRRRPLRELTARGKIPVEVTIVRGETPAVRRFVHLHWRDYMRESGALKLLKPLPERLEFAGTICLPELPAGPEPGGRKSAETPDSFFVSLNTTNLKVLCVHSLAFGSDRKCVHEFKLDSLATGIRETLAPLIGRAVCRRISPKDT